MVKFYFALSFAMVLSFHTLVLMYDHSSFKSIKKSYQVSVNASDATELKVETKDKKKEVGPLNSSDKTKNSSLEQQGVISEYLSQVVALIEAHKDYPLLSRALGEEGVVSLDFTINANGKVEKVLVKSKSSFDRLNQAALNAIYRVKSFPSFPKSINKNQLNLALSLKFLSQP